MDSGSGSLQSSSGADEDYDSHHHRQQQQQPPPLNFPPPPLFFNNNNNMSHIISNSAAAAAAAAASTSIVQQQQQLPFHLSHHNYQNQFHPNFYDLPSNHFNFNPDSSNSFLNLPTSLRSDPTADFISEESTHNKTPNNPSSSPGVLHPKPTTTKKRTRASRRAPTTVLTTDTTNFRAMVQEFTGIPSPPFTAAGSSYSRRFDLFGSVRSTSSTATNREASGSGSGSGSGFYNNPSRSKIQLFSSMNNENVQETGIFSFQSSLSGSERTHLETTPHIHGSSTCTTTTATTNQQLLTALQNDEIWRENAAATTTTATRLNNNSAAAGNCKLNFTHNLQRDKEILLGNIVSAASAATTTRGESTVDSWICPTD